MSENHNDEYHSVPNKYESKLEEYEEVDNAVFEPHESSASRHIPGQQNSQSLAFKLKMTDDFVETVEEERSQQPDDLSDTLEGFMQTLDLDLGASCAQMEDGVIPIFIEHYE